MKKRSGVSDNIIIQLADDQKKDIYPIVLSDEDLKKFRPVPGMYSALKNSLGGRLGPPTLVGASIVMEVFPDEALVPYSMNAFFQDMETAADELRRNASMEKPLLHATAITKPLLVKVLRALEVGYNNFGTSVLLETGGIKRALPVLAPADFTEPDKNDDQQKIDTFQIKGLIRDDENGHSFILTGNELAVRLPRDDPKWVWAKIRNVLDKTSWLEGSLIRESKGHAWRLGSDAKLVKASEVIDEFPTAE